MATRSSGRAGEEESIAALCRCRAIVESLDYARSEEFVEAGKRRLEGVFQRYSGSVGRIRGPWLRRISGGPRSRRRAEGTPLA